MKNLIKAGVAIGALALATGTATADHFLLWDVDKTANYNVRYDVFKDIDVEVDVRLDLDLQSSASAQALVNSRVERNDVDNLGGEDDGETFDGEGTSGPTQRTARVFDSLKDNTGIGQFNQDAGQVSNQGNVASVGLNQGNAFASTLAEAYVSQEARDNDIRNIENEVPTRSTPNLVADIGGSLLDNTGVFHVNQNAGSANQQHNVLSAAVGTAALVALADAGLAQATTGNEITDINTGKRDLLTGSVNDNAGIVNVNQSTGNVNSQATVINVATISSAVGL
jgi:hypothetical protein